ncbi:integrase [Nocardiopsis composta]|uniref:Integrase n=1 Tax=Nocardiopsis composta TaxID=157465 RepID=A0A7W8QSP5_9ACTN|nr:integrase [Nocardiopsis composta]
MKCARLKRPSGAWSSAHGSWGFQIELPRTAEGRRRQARRTGLADQAGARRELGKVKALLEVAEGDADAEVVVADVIAAALKARRELPGIEEMKRRLLGGPVRAEVPTLAQWLGEWLGARADLAPKTRMSYQCHIDRYLVPHLGWVRLDRLAVGHVQAMFEAIAQEAEHVQACKASEDVGVRASVRGRRVPGLATRHRIRATLRSALSAAVARPDLPVQVNVASHAALPSCARKRPLVWTVERVRRYQEKGEVPSAVMVWTPEQTAAFLARAAQDRLYPLFHLIALKGPRRGEAVALQWEHVRLDEAQIDICSQVVQLGWKTITTTPKSEAGRRTITLDAETVQLLRAWRKRQAAERLAAGQEWVDSGRVFTHVDGSGLHPGWVSRLFCRIAAEAGLPPITLHGLRHGAASLSLAAEVDVKVVSAELGHSSTWFTQDTYQSVFPEVAREAAEATAALVRAGAGPGAPGR